MSTHMLPRPKSLQDAENAFLQAMGDPRRLSKYLAVAVTAVAAVAAGLVATLYRVESHQRERIIVRVDDVGRAQAIGYTAIGAAIPQNAVKYFLAQFAHVYFGRNRATALKDFSTALQFMNQKMAVAKMESERSTRAIEKFAIEGDDEIDIEVNNIVLGEMETAPYSAQIDLTKVYRPRNGTESKREKFIAGITFVTMPEVPNAAILVNPLGFAVTSVREDQAF